MTRAASCIAPSHFGLRYFDHVLRGLRRRLPDYVVELVNGEDPTPWLSGFVAGIVLVDVA